MKLAEALEAYKKACILYGYNVGIEGGDGEEEQYTHWREQVVVTEKYLVDAIVEIVKAERNNAQPTGRWAEKFNDDGNMVRMFNS